MKLGIAKIEYIDSRSLNDYSTMPPGSRFAISSFIKSGAAFAQLPFTPETADLEEQLAIGDNGQISEFSLNASLRKDKEQYRGLLQQLLGKKCIWRVTLISGVKYIVGSPEFVPTFSYADGVSGISANEFNISITNDSTHGVFIDL